jgi:hypothetical protein
VRGFAPRIGGGSTVPDPEIHNIENRTAAFQSAMEEKSLGLFVGIIF